MQLQNLSSLLLGEQRVGPVPGSVWVGFGLLWAVFSQLWSFLHQELLGQTCGTSGAGYLFINLLSLL